MSLWWIVLAAWFSAGAAFALAMRGIGGTGFFSPWIVYPVIVLLGPIGPILFYVGKV